MNQQFIPCPTCKTQIEFNVFQLLQGMHYVCPSCHSMISLSMESKPVVENAIKNLENIKKNSDKSNNKLKV